VSPQTATSVSPLLPPPITVGPDGYGEDTRLFQGIPGIERTAGGRLWAAWYAGGKGEGPDNYVVLVTSDDDGCTWSGPKLAIDPPGQVRAFDPCLWYDPQGRLWLFWAQSISWFDGQGGVWCMVADDPESDSPTWSAPRRIADGVMMNKPTVLSTGEWALPVALWDRCKENYPELDDHRFSNAVVSADAGATWAWRGGAHVPAEVRTWDEHMIVERCDGSLWMLVRTTYGIGESVSANRGVTWPDVRPSQFAHTSSRFFIRRLQSGRLLLVKHGLPGENVGRSRLTAFVSDDDGTTWRGGLLLDERTGVSYPDGVQADDGRIYIIYDYDRTGAREILMSVFTEQQVRDGVARAPGTRMRQLVSKGTGTAETAR